MSNHAKRVPGADAAGPGDIYGDDIAAVASQIADAIWPLMIGGPVLFLMIVMGWERLAIPVGIAVAGAQLWLMYG